MGIPTRLVFIGSLFPPHRGFLLLALCSRPIVASFSSHDLLWLAFSCTFSRSKHAQATSPKVALYPVTNGAQPLAVPYCRCQGILQGSRIAPWCKCYTCRLHIPQAVHVLLRFYFNVLRCLSAVPVCGACLRCLSAVPVCMTGLLISIML